MNKLTIPAILVATVMVAGIFAFMPIEKASTVHDTVTTDIGTSFRVSSGSTALGAVDAGNEVFSITCASACIVESIEIWTTADDEDADIIVIENVAGNVPILQVDLVAPANGAFGDIADGTTNPGNIHEALATIQARAPTEVADITPFVITASAGNTVSVDLNNPVDADGLRAVTVIFVGKILGNVIPTVDFTEN